MTLRLLPLLALFGIFGCVSDKQLEEKMTKLIKEKPGIIIESIKKNPVAYLEALQGAAQNAKAEMRKKAEKDEKKKFEASFENPLKPVIRKDEAIRGVKGAPLTLVEYSDFQCPFCKRGFETVQAIMKKYEGKVQFVYKHLPLSFHPQAMIAAQYYEAIRLQSNEKAFKFHDLIFADMPKLKKGAKFLDSLAKKVGANMSKLKSDVNSSKVKSRISEDMNEAAKFGMQGTPGFVLNGIPVKGAYPPAYFDTIVQKLKEKGRVKL